MTIDEFRVLAKGMKAVYAGSNFLPDMEAVNVWYALLKDIPYEIANMAIQKYMLTNKFPPTPADIRECASEFTYAGNKDWSEAWEDVCRLMRRYGRDRRKDAFRELDDLTVTVVKRLGWRELCISENLSVDRANFRDIYNQLVARDKEMSKISPVVRAALTNVATLSLE